MSTLTVANLQGTPASGNIITVPTGHTLRSATTGGIYIPGSVLQVVSNTMTATFSGATGTTPIAVTGLSVTITPRFATSKIIVFGQMFGNGTNASSQLFAYLYKNGTIINTGVTAGTSQMSNCIGRYYVGDANISGTIPFSWQDLPATTSATTYQIYVSGETSTTLYVNRTQTDGAQANSTRTPSVITAMEIGV